MILMLHLNDISKKKFCVVDNCIPGTEISVVLALPGSGIIPSLQVNGVTCYYYTRRSMIEDLNKIQYLNAVLNKNIDIDLFFNPCKKLEPVFINAKVKDLVLSNSFGLSAGSTDAMKIYNVFNTISNVDHKVVLYDNSDKYTLKKSLFRKYSKTCNLDIRTFVDVYKLNLEFKEILSKG